jgi:SPP1 family predicted phage head-tail adaptor
MKGQVTAGELRRRVTIRTVERTDDGGGGYTETPVDGDTVWAAVEPLQGQEQLVAMQTGIERPHRIKMRYRDDVSGVTQLVYDGRVFDVKSVVDPEERHRELVILADEVTT